MVFASGVASSQIVTRGPRDTDRAVLGLLPTLSSRRIAVYEQSVPWVAFTGRQSTGTCRAVLRVSWLRMSTAVLIIPAKSRGAYHLPDLQDFCATLSTFLQETVGLWMIEEDEWSAILDSTDAFQQLEKTDHHGDPIIAAPMSAAPFVYRDDGQPDWGTMWKGFCELALYGGPPHRAPEDALRMPASVLEEMVDDSMIDEIARGILETTGLTATPSHGGWLAVQCDSRRMAAWLSAVIILENVDARSDSDIVFVPGDKGFELRDQVKSVITVVAKANHYWQEHLANESAGGESPARAAAKRVLQGEVIARLRSQKAS